MWAKDGGCWDSVGASGVVGEKASMILGLGEERDSGDGVRSARGVLSSSSLFVQADPVLV